MIPLVQIIIIIIILNTAYMYLAIKKYIKTNLLQKLFSEEKVLNYYVYTELPRPKLDKQVVKTKFK